MGLENLIDVGNIVHDSYRSDLCRIAGRTMSLDREDWIIIHNHPNEIKSNIECSSLQYITEGMARVIFKLPASWTVDSEYDFIVKFPFSKSQGKDNTNGKTQNQIEVEESKNLYINGKYPDEIKDIFCPVVDFDEKSSWPSWVVMPLGESIENSHLVKPDKELMEKLSEHGYTDDINESGVKEFNNEKYRAVDLGTGINKIEND